MQLELLRKWLNLPATEPWPPNFYVLLGLKPGEGSYEEIEERVLKGTEELRKYQTRYEKESTEGQNLLALAQITLTDPEARREYDSKLGLLASETSTASAAGAVPVLELPAGKGVPTPPPSKRVTKLQEPEIFSLDEEEPLLLEEDIPVLEEVDAPLDRSATIQIVRHEPRPRRTPPPLPKQPASEEPRLPVRTRKPARRRTEKPQPRQEAKRKQYRELVRVRAILRVWERLTRLLGHPEALVKRLEIVAVIATLAELRPLLSLIEEILNRSGRRQENLGQIALAVARQPLGLHTFRAFLPEQRERFVEDCRAVHFQLAERYRQLRTALQRRNRKGFDRRVLGPFCRTLGQHPEWVAIFLGLGALVIAFLRNA